MEKSKDYFNDIAEDWDTMRTTFFSNQVREVAYSLANIQSGKIAADLGAGTGFITEGLLNEHLNVLAVDQSENMLAHIQKKFNQYDGLNCILGDSDAIPIADNYVDYVFANMFLHHVVDPYIVIKEMYRILKPGGKIVITDLDEHNFIFLKTEQQDIWMGFDRAQLQEWFDKTGFHDISISCVGCNCCSDSNNSDDKANISIFAAYGVK